MPGNYVAVSVVPILVEFFQRIFDNHTADFPYYLSAAALVIIFVVGLLMHRSFVWQTGADRPAPTTRK